MRILAKEILQGGFTLDTYGNCHRSGEGNFILKACVAVTLLLDFRRFHLHDDRLLLASKDGIQGDADGDHCQDHHANQQAAGLFSLQQGLDLLGDLAGTCRTFLRILGHQPLDHFLHRGRCIDAVILDIWNRGVAMTTQDVAHALALVWGLTGEQAEQGATQAVEIGTKIDVFAADAFRGHKMRRTTGGGFGFDHATSGGHTQVGELGATIDG